MISTEIRPGVHLPRNVFALRPVRIIGEDLREYSGICAPEGYESFPWAKSAMNRIAICGIGEDYQWDNCLVDYLDKEGNIIDSVDISRKAFEYAREQWKFKRIIT